MNILVVILLILLGIVAVFFIAALFMRKRHHVSRDIIINAPAQKVFDYLRFLKNQDQFNKNAMKSPDRVRDFKGTDGTVGYIYSWKGDKDAGEGEKEIKSLTEGRRVETEIRFVKPMRTSATIVMEMDPVTDQQTRLSWSNSGTLFYPVNFLIPMMEKHIAKDMDSSLSTLKGILEK